MTEGYASLPGVRLFYRTMGHGEPVLFLHGGPALPHGYLLPWLEPLARRHRLIFFDQRGVGRSGKPNAGDYAVATCARDIEALRKRLRLGKIHLFGFSWGGALALEFAIRYPDSLRSLTVAEGFVNTDALNRRLGSWLANAPPDVRATIGRCERHGLFAAAGGYAPEYDDAVGKVYPRNPEHPPDWKPPPTFLKAFKELAWDVYWSMWGRDGEFRITGTLSGWDALSRMPELEVPVLLLVSRYGMWTTDEADALAKKLPKARIEVFEHSGHLMFVDEPNRFVEVMEAFLAEAGGSGIRSKGSGRVACKPSGSRSRGT
jgi:proline-specific peptidase